MTTLLIDNYDSFTYNLFQLLLSLGEETIVIRNDDLELWRELDVARVDRIVISPGPGRPQRQRDLGLSLQVLTGRVKPVLGVCLGHQGLSYVSGARVIRAPEPVHGQACAIHHQGRDLFSGLPTPFQAVRYHSLVAVDLPPELECLATTEDGLIMAVRHRQWPAWGVQFHPESIHSEHGAALLGNFLELTGHGHRPPARRTAPAPEGGSKAVVEPNLARGSGRYRAQWLRLDRIPDPAAAMAALFSGQPSAFWFDTVRVDTEDARLSYLGAGAGPLSETVEYRLADGEVRVTRPDGSVVRHPGTIFDYLDGRLRQITRPAGGPVPFNLGYAGWFGYELKDLATGVQGQPSQHPDAFLVLADRMLVIDQPGSAAWLAALEDDQTETAAAEWLENASRTLASLPALPPVPFSEPHSATAPRVEFRNDEAEYKALIEKCQELIRSGEAYELCLTNQLSVRLRVDPFTLFRVLRQSSSAPFSAFFRTPGLSVVGASPERFLTVGDGIAVSKPMKGTRRRDPCAAEDRRLREDLRASIKDRAENLMITDLVRNDLGSVARPGTVRVADLFRVETYEHVHQMVSTVRAELDDGVSAVDCLRAAFPGGSMTGAPKRRAMEILETLEGAPRGIYSGALGWLTFDGRLDLSMVIRTAVVTPRQVTIGVGGAITALSDPADEVAEMLLKAEALIRAVAITAGLS